MPIFHKIAACLFLLHLFGSMSYLVFLPILLEAAQ